MYFTMSWDLKDFTVGTTIFVFEGCIESDFEEYIHNLRHWQQFTDWNEDGEVGRGR